MAKKNETKTGNAQTGANVTNKKVAVKNTVDNQAEGVTESSNAEVAVSNEVAEPANVEASTAAGKAACRAASTPPPGSPCWTSPPGPDISRCALRGFSTLPKAAPVSSPTSVPQCLRSRRNAPVITFSRTVISPKGFAALESLFAELKLVRRVNFESYSAAAARTSTCNLRPSAPRQIRSSSATGCAINFSPPTFI